MEGCNITNYFLMQKKKVGWKDFLSTEWKDMLTQDLFIKPIHVAGILIAFGLAGAVPSPLLGGLFGVAGFLLVIFFVSERRVLRLLQKKLGLKTPVRFDD